MSFEESRQNLSDQRKTRKGLDREFQQGRETLRTIEVRKARLVRLGQEDGDEFQALSRQEAILRRRLPLLQAELKKARIAADDLLGRLAEIEPPQKAVEHLDDRIPFLLLPVRLETRFREGRDPATGAPQAQLWLRIYPDDVHVETHEDILTEDEVASAQAYWTEVWRAGGDQNRDLGAWRVLMRKYGSQRAAWIVKAYQPNNELDANDDSNRPTAPLEEDEVLDPAPTFDPYQPKQETWSRAPRTTTLPDRFVAMGFIGGKPVFEHVGDPIPDPLIVGPNPSHPDDEGEGFREDADELAVDAEMKWMVDFDEAVQVGMGMKIALDDQTASGVDRLIVLGLRLSADEAEAQDMLEALIEGHHYAVDGFSLIPQGTATNNTGSGGSGFKTFDLGDDESFRVELGDPLFTQEANWKRKRDGQYLAEALGIAPSILHHIQYSDGFDQRDARAVNTALWPATLGYFLEDMMAPLFSEDTVRQCREFFVQHVSGRGPIPAIRVGTQPYGILATSAFSRWQYRTPGVGTEEDHSLALPHAFERRLYEFLMRMDPHWNQIAQRVSHAGRKGDDQENLMDILGLHASSAEYHHRFAISLEQFSNMLKLEQLDSAAVDLQVWLDALWSGVLQEFGAEAGQRPELLNKVFYRAQNALTGPFVDDDPLSETQPVRGISQDGENYVEWLATSPIDTIRRQDFGRKEGEDIPPPKALLYLMLRHAVMNAYWDAAWNYFLTAKLEEVPPRVEPAFLYLKDENPGQSKFSILYREAGELSDSHPTVFPDARRTVAEQISRPDIIKARPESASLHDVREALTCLQDRPTAVLARAFSEHTDLCSYRLDAWKLGLANQRLFELRGVEGAARQGIYLGAFGWLEEVRPQALTRPVQVDVPEEFRDPSDAPLQVALDNAGHIHGPSLNHAITAAILRNAFITNADRDNASVTAINLTSERVRIALSIIEGVQNGQEVGALLGYQFERGLHDRYQEAEVDAFVFALRKKFALTADRLNKAGDDVPIQAVEARNVIDGLALIKHVQGQTKPEDRDYPFGLSGLPSATKEQADVINSEVRRMESVMDAVSDLLVAESVFQMVSGNADRTGAVLDALAKAENLPQPEIVQTPRSGLAMTHRLCIQFETEIPASERNPFEGELPLTPRAEAEPGINKWLAGFIGDDPESLVTTVVHVEEGAGPGGEDVEHEETISLKDLGLQPIDLLYILDQDLQQGQSELDSRIAFALRRDQGLAQDARVRIEYTQPVSGKITFFELMPTLKHLRALIADSRALHAADLVLPSDEAQDLDQEATPDENPQGWDVTDIGGRVQAVQGSLAQLKTDLENDKIALSVGSPPSSAFSTMRERLLGAAAFGLQQSVPSSAVEETAQAAQDLISQADAVTALIDDRLDLVGELFPLPAEASIDEQVSTWLEGGGILLGPAFTWMPTFSLKLPDEIQNAFNDSQHILRHVDDRYPFPVDEWLHGLARVQTKLRSLETVILMADNFGVAAPVLTPMQLPYKPDDFWLALDYPPDYDFDGDRLLLAIAFAGPLATTQTQAGLILDEWVEVVPTRNETTGISFHYDAPNSEPPQTLLLAVTPEITGSWQWDDLVATLNETLDMARQRAVEPQHVDETDFSQFLPAIMVPATRYLITVATNLLANVGVADAVVNVPSVTGEG